MNLNPLKKMRELKEAIPNLPELQGLARNQGKQVEIQVKEILKQTVIMERWAIATEAVAEQLDRIAVALETIAKTKSD